MILGIDASNIRAGGGITHLAGLLHAADPGRHGFSRIVVWSGSLTLAQLPQREWLEKVAPAALDRALPWRVRWQHGELPAQVRRARCDVLFVPGGGYRRVACPVVTMSQNLLPFDWREILRFGPFPGMLRLVMLRYALVRAFRRADGLIFLTRHALERVTRISGHIGARVAIVPHGVAMRFHHPPREHPTTQDTALRVVYVSTIDIYKHQWRVIEAVAAMRRQGIDVTLHLVGEATPRGARILQRALRRFDPERAFVRFEGAVPYAEIHRVYASADAVIFASTCENLPQALLEGMASGLPVACSNRGPMPEILGDAGIYFDPERPQEIAAALQELMRSPSLRASLGARGARRAAEFTWPNCADRTFALLRDVSAARAPSD
jgi:glycosyltransferase involved in cell wall biosynthesis